MLIVYLFYFYYKRITFGKLSIIYLLLFDYYLPNTTLSPFLLYTLSPLHYKQFLIHNQSCTISTPTKSTHSQIYTKSNYTLYNSSIYLLDFSSINKHPPRLTGSDNWSLIWYMDFNIISIVSFPNWNLTSLSPPMSGGASPWSCRNHKFITTIIGGMSVFHLITNHKGVIK